MDKFLEEYNKQKELLIRNKKFRQDKLEEAIKKYENIKNSNVDRKEIKLQLAATNIGIRRYALEQINDELQFIRPANIEDIEYRTRQYKEFSEIIEEFLPDDLPLRFHGCPIYNAKKIIESGEISASSDRVGFNTSYDVTGQISVTTKYSLPITVQSYAGLMGNYNMPAGCIFVVLPKDDNDRESGESLLMGNVNFKEEPSRLYAIITTPENINMVSKWCKENNVDSGKVYDYDIFALLFKQKNVIKK